MELDERFYDRAYQYGFSRQGTLAWSSMVGQNTIRIEHLATQKTIDFPVVPQGQQITESMMSEDRSRLLVMSVFDEVVQRAMAIAEKRQAELISEEEYDAESRELAAQSMMTLTALDMQSLQSQSKEFDLGIMLQCATLTDDFNLIVARDDGSVYRESLDEPHAGPRELFDPIPGLTKVRSSNIMGNQVVNCSFIDEDRLIIDHREEERYILRTLSAASERVIEYSDLFAGLGGIAPSRLYGLSQSMRIFSPYYLYGPEDNLHVYHIPDGELQVVSGYSFIGRGGKMAVEAQLDPPHSGYYGGFSSLLPTGRAVLSGRHVVSPTAKIIRYPFDASKREVLLELPAHHISHISFGEGRHQLFVGTVSDGILIVETATGEIKRRFWGQSFWDAKVSDSASTFILSSTNSGGGVSLAAHQVDEFCFEPQDVAFQEGDLTAQMAVFASLSKSDPSDPALLAFLTTALKERAVVREHSAQIQAMLWNIFYHYPILYADLYSRYLSLDALPPFSP